MRSCKESPECGYVATCPDCDGCDDDCECDVYCWACQLERPCACDSSDSADIEAEG